MKTAQQIVTPVARRDFAAGLKSAVFSPKVCPGSSASQVMLFPKRLNRLFEPSKTYRVEVQGSE